MKRRMQKYIVCEQRLHRRPDWTADETLHKESKKVFPLDGPLSPGTRESQVEKSLWSLVDAFSTKSYLRLFTSHHFNTYQSFSRPHFDTDSMDRFLRRHLDRAREGTRRGPDGHMYRDRRTGGSSRRAPRDDLAGRDERYPPSSFREGGFEQRRAPSRDTSPSGHPGYGRSSFSGSRSGRSEGASFWETPEGERYIEQYWGPLDEFDGGGSRGRSGYRAPSPPMYDEPRYESHGPGMFRSQSQRSPGFSHRSGRGPRIELRTPGGGFRYEDEYSGSRYSPASSPHLFESGRSYMRPSSRDGEYGPRSPYIEERWLGNSGRDGPGAYREAHRYAPPSSRHVCGRCREGLQGGQYDDCPRRCGRFHYRCLLDTSGGMRCPTCHAVIPDCG